ncbi:hypothetical protein Btru_060220 [Bulinus truncatus]|nr:hypothetical protein Btru_060220 [Bulinus truncatus]
MNDHRVSDWMHQWDSGSMSQFQVQHPHRKLEEHYDKFMLDRKKARILFPLCGHCFDMFSLADKGHEIVGIDCSELAIKTFFSNNKLEYHKESCESVKGSVFTNKDVAIKIYCCDLFDFKVDLEGQFDVVVDFGSMGAIQKEDLQTYADIMKQLMGINCRYILESFVYDVQKYPDCQPNCFSTDVLQVLFGKQNLLNQCDEKSETPFLHGIYFKIMKPNKCYIILKIVPNNSIIDVFQ